MKTEGLGRDSFRISHSEIRIGKGDMKMDISTEYMGMKLRSPLVPSASSLSDDVDNIRHMEDAGASAVVLYSLFEEQLSLESYELNYHLTQGTDSFAEALTYFPEPEEFRVGPEGYLEHIRKAKEAVDIPVIASLNGRSIGGGTDFARQIEQAGADALELNIYFVPTDLDLAGSQIERVYVDVLREVKSEVSIPVAIKTSAFFSNIGNMAKQFDEQGADALVLFNRFYQPDIDLDALEVRPSIILSTPFAMRVPLNWIGILHGRIKADLAATRGIYTGEDVLKILMAGAKVSQLCSCLFKHGIDHIKTIEHSMVQWMEEHEYESVKQMQGSMSQINCPHPEAFERAQYMKALTTQIPL